MKVHELIKKLLEFDPELEVMYNDSEYGEQDIIEVKVDEFAIFTSWPEKKMKQYVLLVSI